jgi:tetratricopeptide (TPR) repeat protein
VEIVNPQQLAEEGQVEYQKGAYLSAARSFKAAADGFSLTGDQITAAEMANNSSVAFLKAGDGEAALEAVSKTDLVFGSAGDVKRQAMALGNQASALEKLNRLDEALVIYEKSAELLKGVGELELRAYVHQAMSEVLLRRGSYLEAYAVMRAGVMDIRNPNTSQRILKSLMEIPFKFLK